MKRSRLAILAVFCCVAIGATGAAAPYRVLLVDGTKTFEATLRIGGLAGAIRQSGLADVSVIFSDAASPFADPLAGKPAPELPFDLAILIPRGVGDGTADIVWLLVGGGLAMDSQALPALSALRTGIELALGGAVRALGPLDDLWATIMASLYVAEGWLR
jgi:hypothetical protein